MADEVVGAGAGVVGGGERWRGRVPCRVTIKVQSTLI